MGPKTLAVRPFCAFGEVPIFYIWDDLLKDGKIDTVALDPSLGLPARAMRGSVKSPLRGPFSKPPNRRLEIDEGSSNNNQREKT
jgi:hypothetical protein